MKTLAIVLLLFISFNSFSQNTSWNSFYSLLKGKNLSFANLEKHQIKYQDSDSLNIYKSFTRTLFETYSQNLYGLKIVNHKGKTIYYNLNIINKGNKIIVLNLSEVNNENPKIAYRNSQFDKLLQSIYLDLNFKPDTSHKYFNPSHLIFVGFNCSLEDSSRKELDELKRLIILKDKTEIIKWCLSLSPEIRCYGAIGLFHLKKSGIQLSNNEALLLKKIKWDKTLIHKCSGCIEGGRASSILESYNIGKKLFKLLPKA